MSRSTLAGGAVVWSGLAIDIFETVISTYNNLYPSAALTYSYQDTVDGRYGALVNGSWNGAVGEVVRGEAEVAVAQLSWTAARTAAVAFTGPWIASPLGVLVATAPEEARLWAWSEPFSPNLWYAIILVTVTFGLLLALNERCSPYSFRNQSQGKSKLKQKLSARNAMRAAVNNLMGLGPGESSAWSTLIVQWSMAFFSLLLLAQYTSSLTAIATVRRATNPYTSLESIQASGSKFCVLSSSATQTFFESNRDPGIRSLATRMVTHPTYDGCISMIRAGQVAAMIGSGGVLEYLASQPPCDLYYVPMLDNGYFSFPLAKGNPLTDRFTRAVLTVVESGYVGRVDDQYLSNNGACKSTDAELGTNMLDVRNFFGIFAACSVLAVTSFVVLLLEHVVFMQRHKSAPFKFWRKVNKCCGYFYDDDEGMSSTSKQGVSLSAALASMFAHDDEDGHDEDGHGEDDMYHDVSEEPRLTAAQTAKLQHMMSNRLAAGLLLRLEAARQANERAAAAAAASATPGEGQGSARSTPRLAPRDGPPVSNRNLAAVVEETSSASPAADTLAVPVTSTSANRARPVPAPAAASKWKKVQGVVLQEPTSPVSEVRAEHRRSVS